MQTMKNTAIVGLGLGLCLWVSSADLGRGAEPAAEKPSAFPPPRPEAVRHWRFEPAKMNGRPVAVQINVEVNFRLY